MTSATRAARVHRPVREPRALSGSEKRMLGLLGVPTFALTLAITVVSAYMPVVARRFTGSTLIIGVVIGAEGLTALWLPLIIGSWSDRLRTRWGGRLPFLIVATPVTVLALGAMAVVGSIGVTAAVVAVFFVGYFIAYEPYRALYPDAVSDEIAGRAQSNQAIWRGAGTGVALLGGGLLLSVAQPAPFVAAAGVLALSMVGFIVAMVRRGITGPIHRGGWSLRHELSGLRELVAERPALRAFLFANALWELSLAALKTFVVLYLTRGLGFSMSQVPLIIGATAGLLLVAAAASGKLADRYGRARVMRWALPLYGGGLLIPFLLTNRWILGAVLPFVAIGGGFIMSLPYAIVQPLMPEGEHGAVTGYYSVSRGIGTSLGPLLAGLAIGLKFSAAQGYSAMWLVCSAAVLASLPFMGRLERSEAEGARA